MADDAIVQDDPQSDPSTGIQKIGVNWTSDSSAGTVSQVLAGLFSGKVLGLYTNPGATAPTDNYDVELRDSDGDDVLMNAGLDRDTAVSEGVGGGSLGAVVESTLTLVISGAGNSKIGRVVVWIGPS
jgi:hypothetical protein